MIIYTWIVEHKMQSDFLHGVNLIVLGKIFITTMIRLKLILLLKDFWVPSVLCGVNFKKLKRYNKPYFQEFRVSV